MDPDRRQAGTGDPGAGTPWESRFAVVPRSTLAEEIANRVLMQIRAQELRPGDKLPAERNLAQLMNVSRPVLREALRALALMGVVDIRQGAGTYITSLEPRRLIAHLDFAFSKDGVALAQLLEARRVVEAGNVRLAAVRITDPELAELDDLVRLLAEAIADPDRFGELDIAVHLAVCSAARNFVLLQFMNIVSALGRVSRERTGGRREVRESVLRDHRRLLDALRAHDADAAERAMLQHLDRVEAELRSAIGSSTPTITGRALAETGGRAG